MAKKTKIRKWLVLNKCYAKGTLYLEGDTITGEVDFSDNDNFKDITSKEATEEEENEDGNGNDIPSVNAE